MRQGVNGCRPFVQLPAGNSGKSRRYFVSGKRCPVSPGTPVHEEGHMRRVLVPALAILVLVMVVAVTTLGIIYWVTARQFVTGDAPALASCESH